MQKSEKFFIFTWKELTVISLLVAISFGFFFTLGLHYGKKMSDGTSVADTSSEAAGKLEESPEVVPPREALEQGAQHSGGATDESIREATRAEIENSNVKLESPKQVDLPSEKSVKAEKPATAAEVPATAPSASRFAIQLGSYPSKKEAQAKVRGLIKKSIPAEIRQAEVSGQTRFRVVVAGFYKKGQAEAEGRALVQANKISTYIVIRD